MGISRLWHSGQEGWVSSLSAALGMPQMTGGRRALHLSPFHPLKDKWHRVGVCPGMAGLWEVLS